MDRITDKQQQQLIDDNKKLKRQIELLTSVVRNLEKQVRTVKAKQHDIGLNVSLLSRLINKLRD